MVSVMYSNVQQQLYKLCVCVCVVCRSQAWEDSGGGGIKSKKQKRKSQNARAVFLSSPMETPDASLHSRGHPLVTSLSISNPNC
jgi:hypothetical protein